MEYVQQFNSILKSFKIKANCVNYNSVGNYSYFDIQLEPNTRVRDLQKFSNEISLSLRMPGKPSIKILHNEGVVRMEFISQRSESLNLLDYTINNSIPKGDAICLLGQTVDGKPMFMDLSKNPHMIISGTTGSGKSTLLHNIIANMLLHNDVSLFLIDPKSIEFSAYGNSNIPNIRIGYSYSEALIILDILLASMEHRYSLLRSGIDISDMPYGVLIIDEFADLIMQDKDEKFYKKLCALAQKCRAARISIVLATQRPSANVINGTIKANFPARIACKTASHIDSKVVLDATGAENLLGKGDALLRDNTRFMERFQVAYTDANEICGIFGS